MGSLAVVVTAGVMTHKIAKGNGGKAAAAEATEGTSKPITVTQESVTAAMEGSTLKTTQPAVSGPMVERYVQKLQDGSSAPAIKVTNEGVIVEGNHRYVAGRLFGEEPATTPGTLSPSQASKVQPVQEIKVDPNDWGGY